MTTWYKTYFEVFCGVSWSEKLMEMHGEYGSVVRVEPKELHFSDPSAYLEIYNNSSRWDKEKLVYKAFAADHTSVSFFKYDEAKQGKDILQPLFSRRSICEMQGLIQNQINRFCKVLTENNSSNQSSDLFLDIRCWAIGTITTFCFATSVEALSVPDFRAPIVLAMAASLPTIITFEYFPVIRALITGMPPWLSKKISPATAGLIDMQSMFRAQVNHLFDHSQKLQEASNRTLYHELLNPSTCKGVAVTDKVHLYVEAQALMFAGSDTVGNATWPELDQQLAYEKFEILPYLTVVVKESLRIGPGGVAGGLPRIVPAGGATICQKHVPENTIVSIAANFVHYSEETFSSPASFNPAPWLENDSAALEKWLVSFSKGSRMCLGQNLAYCEMYLVFAALFRRFDMELDMNGTRPEDLKWRECFVPHFLGAPLRVFCRPVEA